VDLERAAAASPVPWPAVRQLQQGKTDLEQAQATANIASDLLGVGAAGLAVDAAREARGLYAGASGTSARASIRADGRRGRSDGSTRSPAEGLVDCDALEAHGLAALGREDDAVVLLTHAARRRRGSRRPCPRAADGVRTGRRARQPRPREDGSAVLTAGLERATASLARDAAYAWASSIEDFDRVRGQDRSALEVAMLVAGRDHDLAAAAGYAAVLAHQCYGEQDYDAVRGYAESAVGQYEWLAAEEVRPDEGRARWVWGIALMATDHHAEGLEQMTRAEADLRALGEIADADEYAEILEATIAELRGPE
jgi:hypothetical protein